MLEGCTPWPEEFATRYRAAGFWRGESLPDLLRQWCRRFGSRCALVHGSLRLSYHDLDHRVDRMAAGFLARGIRAGDRVVVQLPNTPEFVVVCFALFRIDAKPVFSLLAHRSLEIGHLCSISGAVGYVVPGRHQGFDYTALAAKVMDSSPTLRHVFVLDGSAPDPGPDGGAVAGFTALDAVDADPAPVPQRLPDPSDVAFFLLSGGTTALPKLIPRTHDDYAYQFRATARINGVTGDDVYLAVLPVEFNFAWGCPGVLGTLNAGGTVVLVDGPDPDECFELIHAERVTFTSLVPSLAQLWLDAVEDFPFDGTSLRTIQIGGAPLPQEVAERIGPAFGCRLQQVFGMAEGLLSVTRDSDSAETVTKTQGRPASPMDEIRIVDESGTEVAPGQQGELLTRGPYTLRGYYRASEHNARAFTDGGFYRTGDVARLTEDGQLVIEGRIKDVIIKGGGKVSAAEVEEHLLTHPGVDRVAVIGVPDPYLGELVCAVVRPTGRPPSLRELRKALHERGLADYKLPDVLEFTADLPLTGIGKVDKALLAKQATALREADAPRTDRDPKD
ncbi:(2,3-dihydroxybenzoyl)adenylate synthase [Streptomyces sp. NPDC005374]|uniref:(2,3-dihydroxybenzoyl)adenylate synthase n=1 Tax=Streptomyces sp. NPDC005374 TaxID=3364713 RepID=UPI0036BD107E